MEEEGAHRRKFRGATGARGHLGGLNEDDEGGDDTVVPKVKDVEWDGHGGRAGPRDQGRGGNRVPASGPGTTRRAGRGFELDLDNATLLGRRHKRTVGVMGSSPLAGKASGPYKAETGRGLGDSGSPMHI